MELNFELLRVAIALIGTAIVAYQDYKTSFIDDKIVYVMIAGGLLLNLLTLDATFILFSIGGALLIGAVGYFVYRQGQFGAGDILLFAALQLLLPFPALEAAKALQITPLVNSAFYISIAEVFPFFFSIFIISSVLAIVGSSAWYAYLLYKKQIKWKPNHAMLVVSTIAAITFMVWFSVINPTGALNAAAIVSLLAIMGATIFSTSMKDQIMNEVIVQKLSIKQIEDEDILATERMDAKLVKKYDIERVLTVENVNKLKKIQREKGVKTFPVYKNLPRFAPYVFVSLILNLLLVSPLVFILLS
ncbi:MAG: prepilin peptidase [Candidatus Micrarchaeota archaeon]|nr:prepilin peptidase [Candidatus Micrarchaeota archaeon]